MTNAERQKLYRDRKRAGVTVLGVVTTTVTDAVTESVTAGVTRTCPNCQVLADEVAALKRQLASANARAAEYLVAKTPRVAGVPRDIHEQLKEITQAAVGRSLKRAMDNEKTVTPHGGLCQCIGCRAGGMR